MPSPDTRVISTHVPAPLAAKVDTLAERLQRSPGDVEAMVGQGVIAKHSEEHLVTSDKGIVMLRRLLQAQLQVVAEGRDPAGVSFDPEAPPEVFTAGNWLAD